MRASTRLLPADLVNQAQLAQLWEAVQREHLRVQDVRETAVRGRAGACAIMHTRCSAGQISSTLG
jgi:hypothetical protein